MSPIFLLDLLLSALPCCASQGNSVCNLLNQALAVSTRRRITGFPCPSALTSFAHLPMSGSRLHLLPTTPQPQTAIQNA
jgi:hypothetical protein